MPSRIEDKTFVIRLLLRSSYTTRQSRTFAISRYCLLRSSRDNSVVITRKRAHSVGTDKMKDKISFILWYGHVLRQCCKTVNTGPHIRARERETFIAVTRLFVDSIESFASLTDINEMFRRLITYFLIDDSSICSIHFTILAANEMSCLSTRVYG